MKKLGLIGLILLWFFAQAFSQAGLSYDMEIQSYCFVDSISPSNQVEFQKIVNINLKTEYLKTADGTATYTPTGTVIPCFRLNGVSECRLRTITNSSNKRKWQLAISDVSSYHDDIFLAAIFYEEFLGEGIGPGKSKTPIPLNYPYGNTSNEATRFQDDLKDWMNCKGIHYIDTSTWALKGQYALDFQIHVVDNNWRINLNEAYFSVNLKDPIPTYIIKSGGNSVVSGINTEEVCEVFRKEKNGAVYYILPYYGTSPIYPDASTFGLLGRRVDCNYQSNRSDDCDRPASQNCYIARTDSTLCTYYCHIPTKDTITAISYMMNGTTTIPINGSYFATVQPDHKQLQDTVQKWLASTNRYGKFTVENTKSTADGWVITCQYTDLMLDSITTNRGKYPFEIVDCKDYLYYDVTRNELGGVVNTINQYGENVLCPPEASVMIPCDQISDIAGCRYKGMYGNQVQNVAGSVTFNLGKFSSFTVYQTGGSGTITNKKYDGTSTTFSITGGMIFSVKSEQKCKYLASQNLTYTWVSGTAIFSYTW